MRKICAALLIFIISTSLTYTQTLQSKLGGKIKYVVAKDGSGNYTTVQAAINAVPDNSSTRTVIFIKKGTYNEKVTVKSSKRNVTLIGEQIDSTIITWGDWAQKAAYGYRFSSVAADTIFLSDGLGSVGTQYSYTFSVASPDFMACNLTFENSAGTVGQAVAFRSANSADRMVLTRIKMKGNQDTYYTQAYGRAWVYDSYLEGNVDFIFGRGAVLFDSCQVNSNRDACHITAACTDTLWKHGYVFKNCKLTATSTYTNVLLGRAWGKNAKTTFFSCYEGSHIGPAGWDSWSKPTTPLFYAEYKNSGPGNKPTSRVSWSKQLTETQAASFVMDSIFHRNVNPTSPFSSDWKPSIDNDTVLSIVKNATYRILDTTIAYSTLKSIKYNGIDLPGFDKNIPSYTIDIKGIGAAVPILTVIADGKKAKVSITNPSSLPGTAVITVTSANGASTNKYYIRYIAIGSGLLAFPGAEGFGRYTTGGRGGVVYHVTKLTDDGTIGTLRYGINLSGARTIVFDVSGIIELKSNLSINNANLTIAGQTAPGDGICIKSAPIVVPATCLTRIDTLNSYCVTNNADNVIIRYIRFRSGDEIDNTVGAPIANIKFENDGIYGRYRNNVIIDHCSMSWGIDEQGSFYVNSNFTMQWCLLGESLYASRHPKGNHGYGAIWGGLGASFHHNLLANNSSRNCRFSGVSTHLSTANQEIVDFRNNVIFNWGFNSTYGGEGGNHNMVNNYYKPGPATSSGTVKYRIVNPSLNTSFDTISKWYVSGNYMDGNTSVTADNWNGGVQSDGNSARMYNPFPIVTVNTQSAQDAFLSVLEHCGASLKRDTVDNRMIYQTRTVTVTTDGTYGTNKGIIDSPSQVGGWPTYASTTKPVDTDQDGMPDTWETANGLNPNNAADRNNTDAIGYTMLEKYLNSIEFNKPIVPIATKLNDTTLKVKWNDIFLAEDSFIVERSVNYGNYTSIARLPMNSITYTDATLKAGDTAIYRIRAKNSDNSSTTTAIITMAALYPANNSTKAIKGDLANDTITLRWEAVAGATSYIVYTGSSESTLTKKATTASNSYALSLPVIAKQYYWRVVAQKASGSVVLDKIMTFTTSVIPVSTEPSTTITINVSKPAQVLVEVFAVNNSKIATLLNQALPAGPYNLTWNRKDSNGVLVSHGYYVISMQPTGDKQVMKVKF